VRNAKDMGSGGEFGAVAELDASWSGDEAGEEGYERNNIGEAKAPSVEGFGRDGRGSRFFVGGGRLGWRGKGS
jgi:hypothetical protein